VSQHELESAARYSPPASTSIRRRKGTKPPLREEAGNWVEAREALIEESRRVLQELTPHPRPHPHPQPPPHPHPHP